MSNSMLANTIERIGSKPIAALVADKVIRVYSAHAEMSEYRSEYRDEDLTTLKQMSIPYVSIRGLADETQSRVKRTLTFDPIDIAATELSGADFKGYIDDWLSLAETMGAQVSWGNRPVQKFTFFAYDPVAVSAISSISEQLEAPYGKEVEWSGKIKKVCETLADKYGSFLDAEGSPQRGFDPDALKVMRNILYREQSLVSASEKTESDALQSFVNQVTPLRGSSYSEEFRRCVTLVMREVRKDLAQRTHQEPDLS